MWLPVLRVSDGQGPPGKVDILSAQACRFLASEPGKYQKQQVIPDCRVAEALNSLIPVRKLVRLDDGPPAIDLHPCLHFTEHLHWVGSKGRLSSIIGMLGMGKIKDCAEDPHAQIGPSRAVFVAEPIEPACDCFSRNRGKRSVPPISECQTNRTVVISDTFRL